MNLDFEKYLKLSGLSPKSIKNYKSDISHFVSWVKDKLKTLGTYVENISEISPFLSCDLVSQYRDHLVENKIPNKTINRRFSTLRHLSRYLASLAIIDSDFMNGINNIAASEKTVKIISLRTHPALSEFQAHLEAEKISKNTIKNYLSDIRQFMNWLEKNHARFA